LLSTAWQAKQFFSFASCSLASAALEADAATATAATRIAFMCVSPLKIKAGEL
jgi:hypothetical protein